MQQGSILVMVQACICLEECMDLIIIRGGSTWHHYVFYWHINLAANIWCHYQNCWSGTKMTGQMITLRSLMIGAIFIVVLGTISTFLGGGPLQNIHQSCLALALKHSMTSRVRSVDTDKSWCVVYLFSHYPSVPWLVYPFSQILHSRN